MNEQNFENRDKIIKQRQFEKEQYPPPNTFADSNHMSSEKGGVSSLSRPKSSSPVQAGSVAAQKQRKEI